MSSSNTVVALYNLTDLYQRDYFQSKLEEIHAKRFLTIGFHIRRTTKIADQYTK